MKYSGIINFDRELTYTQYQKINEYRDNKQSKNYFRISLEITKDGKGLQWDGSQTEFLEKAILDVVRELLIPWGIKAHGIIHASGNKNDRFYDIIVLNNSVKIYENNKIKNIIWTKNN